MKRELGAMPATQECECLHIRCLRLYEDFPRELIAACDREQLVALVAECKKIVAGQPAQAVRLAALRRKGTAHLLLNQVKRASNTAEQIIRLQFDWPYGHLLRADALLLWGEYAAAFNAYQLAEQLLPSANPTDDFGRPEVQEQCEMLSDGMAAVSLLTLTEAAHSCEITATAPWPPGRFAALDRNSEHVRPMHKNARDLQDSVNSAVNDALEAISQAGAVSHVHLNSTNSRSPLPAAVTASTNTSVHDCKSLDQILADELRLKVGMDGNSHDRAGLPNMLDTATSSVTDAPGLMQSDFATRTHGSAADAPSSRSPSPCMFDPDALDSAGTPAAPVVSVPTSPWTAEMRKRQPSIPNTTLSSTGVHSSWNSLPDHHPHPSANQFLATGDAAGVVKIWDVAHQECLVELDAHDVAISCLTFSDKLRKGQFLLFASADELGLIFIWVLDLEGNVVQRQQIAYHTSKVIAARFVEDGRKLVSAASERTICVWNVAAGAVEVALDTPVRPVTRMDCMIVKSAVAVATCCDSGYWHLWDIELQKCVAAARQAGACTDIRFTPRIHSLQPPRPLLVTFHWYAAGSEASIHFWDVFDPEKRDALTPFHSFPGAARDRINGVSFTADAEDKPLMAVCSLDGSVIIYDLDRLSVMTHLTEVHVDGDDNVVAVHAVYFSADGRLLVTCGSDCSIKIWSVAEVEVLLTLLGHRSPILHLSAAGDEWTLASASEYGELAFWDLRLACQLAKSAHMVTM